MKAFSAIEAVRRPERGGETTVPEGPCSFEPGFVVGAWGSVVSVSGGGGERGGNFDESSMRVREIVRVHRNFVSCC